MLQKRESGLVEGRDVMAAVTPPVAERPTAMRAGADLKAARERLGLSLADVATDLRIRMPHLQALEEGCISLLPGNAYALAFVRSYAGRLGLDAEEMVRRFKTEAASFNRRTDLVFPVPMPEHRLPAGAVVLLGAVLAVGVYVGWYRLSGEGRMQPETVTPIPERLAPLAEQALPPLAPPPSAGPRVAVPPETIAGMIPWIIPTDAAEPDQLNGQMPPAIGISPTSAAAAQLPPRPDDPSAATGLAPAAAVGTGMLEANRLLLRANADAWLLVKDRTGMVLLNRTLKAGETWPVPARSDLLLTTGNAGGTTVVLDGATIASLGGDGVVRRELSLDPSQIKDGKLANAAVAPLAAARPRQ